MNYERKRDSCYEKLWKWYWYLGLILYTDNTLSKRNTVWRKKVSNIDNPNSNMQKEVKMWEMSQYFLNYMQKYILKKL